jgi:uncharacterized membrane protein
MPLPATTTAPTGRLPSIDLMRGAVMVIMALDHTRDFFTNLNFEPEDLSQTWGALFFTRWITHFCAPLFFFLAGTGAFYFGARRTPSALTRFLFTRGLWLIVAEFTLIGAAWTFVFPWGLFGVIWCLGASMIVLSVLVRLPIRWLAGVSAVVILLHDLADKYRPGPGTWTWIWRMLHVTGGVNIFGLRKFVLFPLVPWFAVMALGLCFGALLQRPDKQKWLLRLGVGLTLAFVLLRGTNIYGNPPALPGGDTAGDFHIQPTLSKTVILFLDTEKYPPSLQFLLMTLGPSFLILLAIERFGIPRLGGPIVAFGRVPFFFYVLHLYVIHAFAVLVAIAFHQPYSWLLHGGFFFNDRPEGYGYGLPYVYLAWAAVILILYYPCLWFSRMKAQRKAWWLSYL